MKKVLSLVLALVMVLGSFSMVSAAPYSDVAGTTVESAVDRLSLLGILEGYPDGSFKPEGSITRAEFAAVAVRAKGLEAVAQAAKGLPTGFKDVAATSWMSGYVGTAGKLGIVNGVGNGMFAPDAPVKYEEAVTMIVRALGYEAAAQARGGYPYGYLIVANENGLLDAVKGTQGVAATRGLVAQLTDNALEIPMMVQVGFGSEVKWVVSGSKEHGGDEIYLLDEMGFDTYEGRVTSVNTKRNEITLDNEDADLKLKDLTVKVAKGFDFYEVEGLTIKAWYANGEVVLYTVKDEAKFDAVEYDADEKELVLTTEDESYEVARDAVLVLDGKKVAAKDFDADYAKVVLNDDDEIVWAEGYAIDGFIVVEEVDGTEVVSFNDDDLNLKGYTLVKDGKTIAIEELEEFDVVFYNEGEDFAVVYNNSTVGEIERVYNSQFKFEGKVYDNTGLYLDEDVMGNVDADVLAGMMDEEKDVEVFFDFSGKVVLVVGGRGVAKTSSFYGVVYNKTNFFAGRSGQMMSFDVRNDAGELVKYDLSRTFIDKAGNYDGPVINWTTTDLIDSVAKVTVDEDGDITKLEILPQLTLDKEFKVTATYARSGSVDYRLQSGSVVFYNSNKKAIKLGDVDKEFSKVVNGTIVEDKGRVVAVVATETDADSDSTKHTGLVTKVRELTSGAFEFTIKVSGKTEVYVTESKTLNLREITYKNKITTVEIGDKSGNIISVPVVKTGTDAVVQSRNTTNKTIVTKVSSTNTTYELTSNAVIYNNKFEAINLRDLEENDTITVFFDGSSTRFVNYVLVGVAGGGGGTSATGIVTYINTTGGSESFSVDNKTPYFLNTKTVLTDKNDVVLEMGAQAVLTGTNKLVKDDQVEVKISGDVMTIKILARKAELEEAAEQKVVNAELAKVASSYAVPFATANTTAAKAAAAKILIDNDVDTAEVTVSVAYADGKYTVTLTSKEAAPLNTVKAEKVITVTVAPASSDASLSGIKLDGVSLTGFAKGTYNYNVELATGTTAEPVVTATKTDSTANVVIVQAADVEATDGIDNVATITVTAEDGTTILTYKITFTVAP